MVFDGVDSMEMQQILHRYLAKLADAKRVLMVGNDFELLQSLAMTPLSELVIYDRESDPNAPKAETPLGAPLRFRPDWQERPRSKDLVIDLAGSMPKAELERLLKKAGLYVTAKKRRLSDFDCQPLVGRRLAAGHLGSLDVAPTLDWHVEGGSESNEASVAWVFGRKTTQLPSLVSIGDVEVGRSDTDQALIESLETKVANQAKIVNVQEEQLHEHEATNRANAAHEKKMEADLKQAVNAQAALEKTVSDLKQDNLALEQENDLLSARAATLQAEENRFSRLESRFSQYQKESQLELETLQTELRNIAAPAHDLEHLASERDDAKQTLAHLVSAINVLFQNGLAQKKTPKLPPLDVGTNEAPLKLWLARMEALLTDQQGRIKEQATEVKSLKAELRKAQRSASRSSNKGIPSVKQTKTIQIDLTTASRDTSESKLEALLALEQSLRADAEARLSLTVRRTEVMAKLYDEVQTDLSQMSEAVYEEKSLRVSAEADRELLKQELAVKHDELEERGRILDTYASLQGLLSDSLSQAEEARLEAEDARRLADENLRILRDEFERTQQSKPVEIER